MENKNLLAAVDLGSNSFRLSVGRIIQREGVFQIYAIDRLKETVRLAAGLDDNKVLSKEAIDRAISTLKRFAERIQDFSANQVRAVATNTFRVATNVNDFLPKAEAALGFPIEVISGPEEARLVFSGVVHELPPSPNRRLVVDIGGGSTEFIIGTGYKPDLMVSLSIGCVSFTEKFFPKGQASTKAFDQAEFAARKEIEVISKKYKKLGWLEAYGSSGTAKALIAVLEASGFSEKGITLEGMQKLKKVIIKNGSANSLELHDLKADRIEVLPAGLSIMLSIFKELGIKRMDQGEGALRVGVLYDMMGRQAADDKRIESVKLFMRRYHIDTAQATRVKQLALQLFDESSQGIKPTEALQELRLLLGWACDLHEIGLSISQASYHRHTAYVLENADMPGFSRAEQQTLSLLTLSHQGKLNKLNIDQLKPALWCGIISIRFAVLFLRKHQNLVIDGLNLKIDNRKITLTINQDWLQKHSLTEYSLNLEAKEWKQAGFEFQLNAV